MKVTVIPTNAVATNAVFPEPKLIEGAVVDCGTAMDVDVRVIKANGAHYVVFRNCGSGPMIVLREPPPAKPELESTNAPVRWLDTKGVLGWATIDHTNFGKYPVISEEDVQIGLAPDGTVVWRKRP